MVFPPLPSPTPEFSKRSRSGGQHRLPSGLLGFYGGLKAKSSPEFDLFLLASIPRMFLPQFSKPNRFLVSRRLLLTAVLISQRSRTSLVCYSTARRDIRRQKTTPSWGTFLLSRISTWMKTSVHSHLQYYTRTLLSSLRPCSPRCRLVSLHQKRRVSTPLTAISHLRTRWKISLRATLQPLWWG